ncbi:MAG: OadG family protein [Dorea sp.]|nr:OadG family protein [Dorea sp.]
MKKRISLFLCLLMAVFTFTACGGTTEEVSVNEDAFMQSSEMLLNYCMQFDDETLESLKSEDDLALNLSLISSGLPFKADTFIGALESWKAAETECGNFVEHGDYTVTVKGNEVKVTTDAQFADRTATISFLYHTNSYLESMTVDANFSLNEILQKAGLNTILGMGTVFAVLIFISIIISLFVYIPMIEEKFKNKGKKEEVKATSSPAPVVVEEEEEEDDLELIAVIAAAIAMQEGVDPSGFVVRSIRRRPSNKWAS